MGGMGAVMEHAAPAWVNRVGDTSHTIIADSFNGKVGPIVGLRIEADGTVVKTGNQRRGRADGQRGGRETRPVVVSLLDFLNVPHLRFDGLPGE